MGQCGAFLQFLVDMVHFGRGGGAPPWTPFPLSPGPLPPSLLRSSNALGLGGGAWAREAICLPVLAFCVPSPLQMPHSRCPPISPCHMSTMLVPAVGWSAPARPSRRLAQAA